MLLLQPCIRWLTQLEKLPQLKVCLLSGDLQSLAITSIVFYAGAYAMGTAFTLSTIATSSLEDIAAGAPDVLRFFQLYIYRDRDVTRQLVRRAESAGFSALILTVDTPFFGKRLADNRNKFKLPPHLKSVLPLPYQQYLDDCRTWLSIPEFIPEWLTSRAWISRAQV